MLEYTSKNQAAIIVLHEIYGINQFIEETCQQYHRQGFDVFCPNLLKRENPYTYKQQQEAYQYFNQQIGFECYLEIEKLINQLKRRYQKVFLVGFSVGATIAWRCNEHTLCNGVVCVYGSRIRDFLSVNPTCPTLLIIAEQDLFDVVNVTKQLEQKENTRIEILKAEHGFCDRYGMQYDEEAALQAAKICLAFLKSGL